MNNETKQFESTIKTVLEVCLMGKIIHQDIKSQNRWMERMIKAGISGVNFPENWNELSEEEKQERLNNMLIFMEKIVDYKNERNN